MSCTLQSRIFPNFVIANLEEIESEFEKTLAYLSDAQMGSNREKIKLKNLMSLERMIKLRGRLIIY